MKNITKLFAWLIPAFLFIFFTALPANAFYFQTGNSIVLPKGSPINEAALVTGSSITVDSDINGDLYCAGRDVVVNGNIKGDIICASQSLKVNGTVDGNIRAAGQTIEVAGQVSRNITVASQSLILDPKSIIKGDVFFGVQNVELNGAMNRDLAGAGETITVAGSLLRNATVTASNLSVIETGKIGGNLDYYLEKTATASINVKNIKGTVVRHDIQTPQKMEVEKKVTKVTGIALATKIIFGIISFMLLGLALVYFNRENTERRIALIRQKPLVLALIGFAVLIVAPIFFIILFITIIGIPFAFVALLVYIAALITASLYPSALYGKLFVEKIFQKTNVSIAWHMVIGVIILGLLSIIPIIGWIIAFISFCLGLGAFVASLSPEKK